MLRNTSRATGSRRARRSAVVVGLAVAVTLGVSGVADAASGFSLATISNRADLVSGGQALVRVGLPHGTTLSRVRVLLGSRNVTSAFAVRPDGHVEGMVTGLRRGRNVLKVLARSGRGAALTIVDHRIQGPVFAGPQLQPWTCRPGALDADCDRPTTYRYVYMPVGGTTFEPYDPAHPPADVAQIQTQTGVKTPYVVRVESGNEDRDQYQIAVLFNPKEGWTPWSPQATWNHKLVITHGQSCGVRHGEVTGTGLDTLPKVLSDGALRSGFAVASTALDDAAHNCNLALQAESIVMAKEHFVESYGPIRYTIGTGCSGGSLAINQIANAYPGLYQGLLPSCTFPDAWSSAMDAGDCPLMTSYWRDSSAWGAGVGWTPAQEDAVAGKRNHAICLAWTIARFADLFDPTLQASGPVQNCGITPAQAFDPATNPDGVRCTLQDAMINLFGKRPDGYANRPWDNVGVQYGLVALRQGTISPAQFVDLNTKIGSRDINAVWQQRRVAADRPGLVRAYRTGAVNEATNLNRVAIIDIAANDADIHEKYRAFAISARMDAAYGNHRNHVVWYGKDPVFADRLPLLDGWLDAVHRDHRHGTLAAKIVRDKPKGLTDQCNISGTVDPGGRAACDAAAGPGTGTRGAAGSGIATDVLKCALKPLRARDYGSIRFTAAQWAALKRTFPTGVCDWRKPGVGQQPTVAWQTYSTRVGGRPLGPAPRSRVVGPRRG
jgi:hypothetical protein